MSSEEKESFKEFEAILGHISILEEADTGETATRKRKW